MQDDIITCVNECPNCLDKNLFYAKGTKDEVDSFFRKQELEEKILNEKLANNVTVHQVIKLWPRREVIHEC